MGPPIKGPFKLLFYFKIKELVPLVSECSVRAKQRAFLSEIRNCSIVFDASHKGRAPGLLSAPLLGLERRREAWVRACVAMHLFELKDEIELMIERT